MNCIKSGPERQKQNDPGGRRLVGFGLRLHHQGFQNAVLFFGITQPVKNGKYLARLGKPRKIRMPLADGPKANAK